MSNGEEINRQVELAVNTLKEFADHVQVMVTYQSDGHSHLINSGFGNYYARVGMCHDMIQKDKAFSSIDANTIHGDSQD